MDQKAPPFQYLIKNPMVTFVNLKDYFNGKDNVCYGRKPIGTEYKKAAPILFFGDSYAHGQYLEPNQTFAYKLSKTLKRPVYNRAIPGASFQHMYYQVSDDFAETFFKQVPYSDLIFFIIIDPHYERMTIFSDFGVIYNNFYLRYKFKNGKFIKDNYNNYFLNAIKSSYIIRTLNISYVKRYISNPKNADKLTDEMTAYFIETRKKLEEHWDKKSKFVVILYSYIPIRFKKELRQKLEQQDFIVIDTDDLTDVDLSSEKYMFQDNLHPKEAAWNLLTPKIIKTLDLDK